MPRPCGDPTDHLGLVGIRASCSRQERVPVVGVATALTRPSTNNSGSCSSAAFRHFAICIGCTLNCEPNWLSVFSTRIASMATRDQALAGEFDATIWFSYPSATLPFRLADQARLPLPICGSLRLRKLALRQEPGCASRPSPRPGQPTTPLAPARCSPENLERRSVGSCAPRKHDWKS